MNTGVTLVIAGTVPEARRLTDKMAGRCLPLSPRSIRHFGGGRGFANVTAILVHESVWPLAPDISEELAPYRVGIQKIPG